MELFIIIWSIVGVIAGFALKRPHNEKWNLKTSIVVGFLLGPIFWLVAILVALLGLAVGWLNR